MAIRPYLQIWYLWFIIRNYNIKVFKENVEKTKNDLFF